MKIHEVENMSAAGMKQNRDAIIESLSDESPANLIERYYQARLDAKIRDEKLTEQAKTLEALQIGLDAAKQKAEIAEAAGEENAKALSRLQAEHEVLDTKAKDSQQIADKTLADKDAAIRLIAKRCDRLKTQAELYATAMTTIQKAATDAIATRVIDEADKDE